MEQHTVETPATDARGSVRWPTVIAVAVLVAWFALFTTFGSIAAVCIPSLAGIPILCGVLVGRRVLPVWVAPTVILVILVVDFVVGDHLAWADLPYFGILGAVMLAFAGLAGWITARLRRHRPHR